jgi:hypothetical protein
LFIATQKFYYRNRGTGEERVDVPAFFKRNQYKLFKSYWQRSNLRPKFNNAWSKFSDAIETLEAD